MHKRLSIFLFLLLPLILLAEVQDTVLTSSQLVKRIAIEIDEVDATLPQINILLKKGEKIQAKKMVHGALSRINRIEAYQQQLIQSNEPVEAEDLMLEQTRTTKNYLQAKANQLRYSIKLFVTCTATIFNANYSYFSGYILRDLADMSVTFVNSPQEADWIVTITASARESNYTKWGDVSTYFSSVDALIVIDNNIIGQRVYQNALSEKGGHTQDYTQAAQTAYERLAPKICNIIREQIQ